MPAFNKILDTFLYKNGEIYLREFHADRVFETYRHLNSKVSREDIGTIYDSLTKQLNTEVKSECLVRVLFDPVRPHKHTVEIKDLEPVATPVKLMISEAEDMVSEASQYKFADRPQWEALLASKPEGCDDVVLVRNGLLVETSRFNLFLHDTEKNLIYTPTLSTGCINGVLRRFALRDGVLTVPDHGEVKVIEKDFSVEDLGENNLFAGNSVRGLLPAKIL
ncbi:MAG: hypothetical protein K0R29_990 [Pseudobdellovibrio sp.]|nr:hypothetical protein [Pseudobdellovibrio sp.]